MIENINKKEFIPYDIYSLSWVELVRKRAGLYIGTQNKQGIYHLLYSFTEDVITETTVGAECNLIIILYKDNSLSVEYNLSQSIQTNYTQLETGIPSNDLHILDLPVISPIALANAFSEWLILDIFTGEKHYQQHFHQHIPVAPVQEIGSTTCYGKRIRFLPDRTIFSDAGELSSYPILAQLRDLAVLTPSLIVRIEDQRICKTMQLTYNNGIQSYLEELDQHRLLQHLEPIYITGTDETHPIELALRWCHTGPPVIHSFVNKLRILGGSHVNGLWKGIIRGVDTYARKSGFIPPDAPIIRKRELNKSLTCIIKVNLKDPQFANAAKDNLNEPKICKIVAQEISKQLPRKLEEQKIPPEHLITRRQS